MAMTPISAPAPASRQRRRRRTTTTRPHRLGPLKLSDAERADVYAAAARAGMSPGSYAAHVAVAAARQELLVLPLADRDRIAELIHARVELARTAALLPARDAHTLLPALTQAARRVEAAADAISRHPAATPKTRAR
ncbi:hypothetical protein ACU635_59535 [[Actinomadura] parvosata]|uniref:hypothetical protein n=1 Tax=[Actinomadura] parvosata TaxID=1955412 RepID=UPI00406C1D82